MKKRIMLAVLLAVITSVLMTTGCYRQYVSKAVEPYTKPIVNKQVETITEVQMVLNPIIDIAEGGNGRDSKKAIVIDPKTNEVEFYQATLNGEVTDNCLKLISVYFEKSAVEVAGRKMGYFNNSGTMLYNELGKPMLLKSLYFKLDPADYEKHLFTINSGSANVKEYKKGSPEFERITKVQEEINFALKYVQKTYPNRPKEELEDIAFKDTIVYNLIEYLGKDWYLYITIPFMSVSQTLAVVGIAKIMRLPSIFGDKINKDGFDESQPSAGRVGEMIIYGIQDYAVCLAKKEMKKSPATGKKTKKTLSPLLKKSCEDYSKSSCETVADYNEKYARPLWEAYHAKQAAKQKAK